MPKWIPTPSDGLRLADAIDRHHPDPYRSIAREALLQQAERIAGLSRRDRNHLVVELMRLVTLLGERNGHSGIFPLDSHPLPLRAYPIRPYEFDDGVFIVSGEPELVGSELIAVAGIPLDQLSAAITPLVPHDNEWTIRLRRPTFLVNADVLHGLDILDRPGRATVRLRLPNGELRDHRLEPLPVPEYHNRVDGDERLPQRPSPTYLRRRGEPRWLDVIEGGRAIHVAYNITRDDISEFAAEVAGLADPENVRLVIVDLRHNVGGDNRTYAPLLDSLEHLATTGGKHLTVLTSRATFSAAMQLVVDLEQRTPAVFVGEPTGGSPNQYGDAIPIMLPETGLTAHVATIAWRTAGDDHRTTRHPDVPVPLQASAFFSDDDPTLATALHTAV